MTLLTKECHPEPKAKDLGRGFEQSLIRRPDPSLRFAAFRMTSRAGECVRIRVTEVLA